MMVDDVNIVVFQSALQRLRSIEESIESERAAHLETKFNSEIVQVCNTLRK